MLDLRRLRLLHELRYRGTLAAVAEALHYSASAVSQQLTELEREAGVSLLERAGRGVRLTDAGLLLAEHAAVVLAEVERAEAAIAQHSGTVAGEVRVGSPQTPAVNILPGALVRLRQLHPQVMVQTELLETAPGLDSVLLGETDLMIGLEYEHNVQPKFPGTERHELLNERMMLALPRSHRLAKGRKPLRLADLRDEVWSTGPLGGHHSLVFQECNTYGGFQPIIHHRTPDLLVQLALVAAGEAVTFLPEMLVTREDPDVVLREVAEHQAYRVAFILSRASGSDRPALVAVRDALQWSAGELVKRRSERARVNRK